MFLFHESVRYITNLLNLGVTPLEFSMYSAAILYQIAQWWKCKQQSMQHILLSMHCGYCTIDCNLHQSKYVGGIFIHKYMTILFYRDS